jgi:hypothetical protein
MEWYESIIIETDMILCFRSDVVEFRENIVLQ